MEYMNKEKIDEANEFNYFRVGTIFNPIQTDLIPEIRMIGITIDYPVRLNAMAIDPSRIAADYKMMYSPGEIVFSTKLSIQVTVKLLEENVIRIEGEDSKNAPVIKHVCMIMAKAFGYTGGFEVVVNRCHEYRHCGLGSTGGLQSAVAACINEIFSKPFRKENLVKYLARNYGEEIDHEDEYLNPVQCIGGSAANGFYDGGVLVLAGHNTVIATGIISDDYDVLIGVPNDYIPSDSESQFNEEKQCLDLFANCGNVYGQKIAYNVLHYFLPALVNQDVSVMGDVIYDYRYNMGSNENCSYTYKNLVPLLNNLAYLKKEGITDVLSISSVGPAVFAIVKLENSDQCRKAFEKENLSILETKINNNSYHIVKEYVDEL